jgi:hypothetical protein
MRGRIIKNPSAKKFFGKTTLIANSLRQKSSRILAGAGLIGTLLTIPMQSSANLSAPQEVASTDTQTQKQKLVSQLQDILPHLPSKITPQGAETVEKIIKDNTNISTKAYYQGQSLNHTLGFVGFEQHLKRFPGDSLNQHDEIQEAGMAPGLGAFGYFTNDASTFTTTDYLREKYYCVVQTLYLENWNSDYKMLKDFYKFRKMLIVNPVNGEAVVCAIGDAGPAEWTGKQFGASPEAMQALDLNKGPRKGLILMLFVDDPNNLIPLGPIK